MSDDTHSRGQYAFRQRHKSHIILPPTGVSTIFIFCSCRFPLDRRYMFLHFPRWCFQPSSHNITSIPWNRTSLFLTLLLYTYAHGQSRHFSLSGQFLSSHTDSSIFPPCYFDMPYTQISICTSGQTRFDRCNSIAHVVYPYCSFDLHSIFVCSCNPTSFYHKNFLLFTKLPIYMNHYLRWKISFKIINSIWITSISLNLYSMAPSFQ